MLLQTIPQELFTPESLTTLVGLTGMVYVVSNGLQRAFNFNPKWLALIIAQVLTLISVYIAFKDVAGKTSGIEYLIGVINGFLVYLTASGATTVTPGMGGQNANPTQPAESHELEKIPEPRSFNSSWW